MTKKEFENHFNRLAEAFPHAFASHHRRDLIAKHVSPFEEKWWSDLVDRMILNNDPRFDIEQAVRGERLRRSNLRLAQETTEAWDNLTHQMTDAGFNEVLGKFGAKSLWDAVKNAK